MEQKPRTGPSRAHEMAVERLIELASEEHRPVGVHPPTEQALVAANHGQLLQPLEPNAPKEYVPNMWKALFFLLPQILPLVRSIRTQHSAQNHLEAEEKHLSSPSETHSRNSLDQTLALQGEQMERLERKIIDLAGSSAAQLREQQEQIKDIHAAQGALRSLMIVVLLLLLCLVAGMAYVFLHLPPDTLRP